MYLKFSVSVMAIITLLLMPELTTESTNEIEWPGDDINSNRHVAACGIHENYKKKRKKRESESPVDNNKLGKHQNDFYEAEDFGIRAMNEFFDIQEPGLFKKGLFLNTDHPAGYVAAFNRQSDEAKLISKVAYAALKGSRKLIEKYSNESKKISLSDFKINMTSWTHRRVGLRERCPRRNQPQCSPASLKYRTADGSCNNLKHLWWGSAMSTMQRFLDPVYADGVDAIRTGAHTGRPLPSPRDVSMTIHEDKDVPLASITHMLMQWGQFIDHDMTATAQSQGFNGTFPQCCRRGGAEFQPPELMHPDCLPIIVNPRDNFFGRLGVRCLEFVRSGPAPREDCGFGPREQLSQVTSFLDGSMIYSSNVQHSDSLRIFRGGLLQYGKLESRKGRHARAAADDSCRRGSLSSNCFRPGDARLTEQPGLTSLHVVFLRLHNRMATDLSHLNPHWSDEKIFQESRKIVGAVIQHITYREFLPIVLGPEVMKIFDLELKHSGYYNAYDSTTDPNIANSFSTAAYRFGHSLVQRSFSRYDEKHHLIFDNVSIHEELSNRMHLHSPGSVDRLLLGLVNQPAQRRDEFITTELTNHLFQFPNFPFGMDLAAINIQRGRDHGLPPYIEWREPCSLTSVNNWEDLERITSPTITRKFRLIYDSIEDVDLFAAGLSEKPVKGGLVGPTFACIIAQQFSNLRKGDRFWYENENTPSAFTLQQIDQIRRVSLARILCRTLDNVNTIQPFVFLTSDTMRNDRISCNDQKLGTLNLQPWAEVTKNIEDDSSNNSNKMFDVAKTIGLKKSKPIRTNVNQKNRIIVRRPVGTSHDNVTIVVNNHAVNSPIFVNDAIYGSNINTKSPVMSTPSALHNVNQPADDIYPTFEQHLMQPINPTDPYSPVTLQDPNDPNPPKKPLLPIPITRPSDNLKPSTTPNNEAWVNIGPLLDQLKPNWYHPSGRPTAIYHMRMKSSSDKIAKVDSNYGILKPSIQHNNGTKINFEKQVTMEKIFSEAINSSATINQTQSLWESNEIPRPIKLISNSL